MNNSSLLIVIVNFRNTDDTLKCLISLKENSSQYLDVLILDNSSNDGSTVKLIDWLRNNNVNSLKKGTASFQNSKVLNAYFIDLHYKLFELKENYGFAGANNVGLNYASTFQYDYILLLNNDTLLINDSYKFLIESAEENSRVGIVGGKALDFDRNKVVSAGGKINWLKGCGNDILTSKVLSKKCYVDFVSGCFMLIRRELLDNIGYMNDEYFLYYEDVDYCLRAHQKGWKIVYQPNGLVLHKEGGAIVNFSPEQYYWMSRARIIFNKRYNPVFPLFFIYFSFVSFVRIIRWFFAKKVAYIKSAVDSYKFFLTHNSF